MKRTLAILLSLALLLGCAAVLSGCSENKVEEYPVTYGDVVIEKEPEAIVVLNDCAADIISYIGYDVKMAGRSSVCDQSFLSVVPSVGTSDNPSVDAIIETGADLVIGDRTLAPDIRESLENEGIVVISAEKATDMEGLKALYSDLGAVLGGTVTGRKKGEDAYNKLFDLLDQFTAEATGVIKTAAYLYMDQNGQICTFTEGSIEQQIFDYNGAMNIFSNQEAASVDPAQLRLGSPTCIFYDEPSVLDYLRNDEALRHLAALNKGNTMSIPLKNFYRQGRTFRETVFEMIDFLNKLETESTADEATPDEDVAWFGGYDGPDDVYDSYGEDGYSDDGYSDDYGY